MSSELGKIEKPGVEEFESGRRLYFVPVIYAGSDSPEEYLEKYNRYWNQVEDQVSSLELKLGRVSRLYHELVTVSGEGGVKTIKELNGKSYDVVVNRLDKGAQLEAIDADDLLAEIMDWSRCLTIGLQNRKVFSQVYESYLEASQKRNEGVIKKIDETLGPDEIGILFMREKHDLQFPNDIRVFYVAPPSLDEINRWLRDYQAAQAAGKEPEKEEDAEKDQP